MSAIDYADIQGLVRFAHARLGVAAYLLLDVQDAASARAWLRNAPITTASYTKPKPKTAMQVAFSAGGLHALGAKPSVLEQFSDGFIAGMVDGDNRSRRLGDVGANDPQHWRWGGSSGNPPDILLMLFAKPKDMESLLADVQSDDFLAAFTVQQILKSEKLTRTEPFGFADGISQPKIDWDQQVSTDLHQRDRFSNLLSLGEVLLGYKNEYGLYTDRPLLNKDEDANAQHLPVAEDHTGLQDLGKNGSYLVFRQLAQDVPGFWQTIDHHAQQDTEQREQLASAMVGRQRDGTSLVEKSDKIIEGIPVGSSNHFNYDDDPFGQRCPVGSHVRRANPRTGDYPTGVNGFWRRMIRLLGFKRRHPYDDLIASTRFHRILRRGRPYGSALTPEQALQAKDDSQERGLHFVCLGANISRQFEFVQNAWLISSKFAGLPTEQDPIVGNREHLHGGEATDGFSIPQHGAASRCVGGLPQFVTVVGGGYFFLPGLAALKYIASEPEKSREII